MFYISSCLFFFFFNDTATTEIYTLSLHDALPISMSMIGTDDFNVWPNVPPQAPDPMQYFVVEDESHWARSEEHTSELQSLAYLVCRLLLEKKKTRHRSEVCCPGLVHGVATVLYRS